MDRQTRAAMQAAEQGRWGGGRRPSGSRLTAVLFANLRLRRYGRHTSFFWTVSACGRSPSGGMMPGCLRLRARVTEAGHDGPVASYPAACGSRGIPRWPRTRARPVGVAQWPPLVDSRTLGTQHRPCCVIRCDDHLGVYQKCSAASLSAELCGSTVHAGGGATGRGVYRCSGSSGHVIRKRQPVDEFVDAVIIERPEPSRCSGVHTPFQTGPGDGPVERIGCAAAAS